MDIDVQNQNIKMVNVIALNIHYKTYYKAMVYQNYDIARYYNCTRWTISNMEKWWYGYMIESSHGVIGQFNNVADCCRWWNYIVYIYIMSQLQSIGKMMIIMGDVHVNMMRGSRSRCNLIVSLAGRSNQRCPSVWKWLKCNHIYKHFCKCLQPVEW